MKTRKILDLARYPELFAVLTAAETARHIGIDRKTVQNAINDCKVAAVQVGRIWLVSKESAESLWWEDGHRKATRRRRSHRFPVAVR